MGFGKVGIGKVGFRQSGNRQSGIRRSGNSAKGESAKWDSAKWDSAKWEDTMRIATNQNPGRQSREIGKNYINRLAINCLDLIILKKKGARLGINLPANLKSIKSFINVKNTLYNKKFNVPQNWYDELQLQCRYHVICK